MYAWWLCVARGGASCTYCVLIQCECINCTLFVCLFVTQLTGCNQILLIYNGGFLFLYIYIYIYFKRLQSPHPLFRKSSALKRYGAEAILPPSAQQLFLQDAHCMPSKVQSTQKKLINLVFFRWWVGLLNLFKKKTKLVSGGSSCASCIAITCAAIFFLSRRCILPLQCAWHMPPSCSGWCSNLLRPFFWWI